MKSTIVQCPLAVASGPADASRIINSPREYQLELFEQAKRQNTIVVLDTGSGKTLIAALLLRHTIDQEYEDRKQGHPHRISVFLVDKIALAKQQHRVLKENLDCNIACFAGDNDPRDHDFWKQQLENNLVIVCVGAVLQNCLHRAYIRMEQINLLIFDEAHHAKREHPYARIVTDFFVPLANTGHRLPRIFGMTASPVDAKTDFDQAASDLETLLHSKIATVGDLSVFQNSVHKAEEHTIEYGMSCNAFETALSQRLRPLLGNLPAVAKLFVNAQLCTSELGPWCADHMWRLAFDERGEGLKRLQMKVEYEIHDIAARDDAVEAAQAAQGFVDTHRFVDLASSPLLVSNKVHQVFRLLQDAFRPSFDKCVIFVAKRYIAVLLVELLESEAMRITGVSAAKMIGTGKAGWGEPTMTIREQILTVLRFLRGDVNVLVATSVAEEGLDIPDCNMVVRFDPCSTMIQYVQSRGRARQAQSRLYHLVQAGHHGHRALLSDIQEQEAQMRKFCATQPEDRRVDAVCVDELYPKRAEERRFTIPSTGAKLTYRVSLDILASFVQSLPRGESTRVPAPEYTVRSAAGSLFLAEVRLPDVAPITYKVGKRESSKQLARCAAAFEMCKELRAQKCLDEWFRSVFTKNLPAMRNKRLALTSTKVSEYEIQIKPSIWSTIGFPGDELHVTIITLATPSALGRASLPLAFLSRSPMPMIGDIPLFFANKGSSLVRFVPMESAMRVTKEQVVTFTNFTLRIFRDVFSKEYAAEPGSLPYYLAPVQQGHSHDFAGSRGDMSSLLDWDQLDVVGSTDYLNTTEVAGSKLSNRYVIDPHDGSRKFYTVEFKPDLKPADNQLSSAPRSARVTKATKAAANDIWNYSVSLWSSSRSNIQRNEHLQVVEAELITIRQNLLDSTEQVEPNGTCYLVFETLKISALRPDVVAMAYLLPAVIYRLDSTLIAFEACASTGLSAITPSLALTALTKTSDNTGEHDQEQINFQPGMGENYERLEFLGDSFLKMSTTIALFAHAPRDSEFFQHVNRMVLINNGNLYQQGLEFGLPEKIRSRAFNRRLWYPEGLVLLHGKQNVSRLGSRLAQKTRHTLAAKTIADVCEALIGAAYLTAQQQGNMDLAVLAVTKFVKDKEQKHTMEKWAGFYPMYKVPDWQTAQPSAAQQRLAEALKQELGHVFRSPALARCAFTHPSYSNALEGLPHYEQLEFLGDALLDMVCVDHLFRHYPAADPQWLTEHKMAMVSNQFLAFLCVSLGLHRHMLSMDMSLGRAITQYVEAVALAREDAETRAEAAGLARQDCASDFWMQLHKPPKALGDVVEAYLGAIFVDSEFDFSRVREFFTTHILPYFLDMQIYDAYAGKQPITLMLNILQERFHCQQARIMSRTVPKADAAAKIMEDEGACVIMIHGVIVQHGVAASERYAKIKAAKELNKVIEDMGVAEYRKKYGCTCRPAA
ncbi:uncharacterized protein B0I36DRAFT_289245 [Microdochium trichocladiopsis]|uniref:Dicer-like protein 1 n=1 Tax=Microdochium trichocladiopsis TaxID=1682393 RepID=A0A9P9BUA5_9PEZI|nr:uncharacterized protein B0I36DRAFT_289245 [Microdochium trichocladiopsis]KAH7031264.1 hypothetical protein B0I36DRAFT_289245 [Microdochium trichocladiopsis]